jgi:hypothetical protein
MHTIHHPHPEQEAVDASEDERLADMMPTTTAAVGEQRGKCPLWSKRNELFDGCYVVPGCMQDKMNVDPRSLHDHLNEYIPMYPNTAPLRRGDLRKVPGSHPALQFRGRPIWRSKVWLQTDFEEGLRRYYYTGWSWAIADATAPFDSSPELSNVLAKVNAMLPAEQRCNHGIYTWYDSLRHNIGFHQDKTRDIASDSLIIVLKLGHASRTFSFRKKRTAETPEPEPFWTEKLEPGTAVIMSTRANELVEHAVLADGEETACTRADQSSSLVLRRIDTVIPWETVDKKQAAAAKAQTRRKEGKRKRQQQLRLPSPSLPSPMSAKKAATTVAKVEKKGGDDDAGGRAEGSDYMANWFARAAASSSGGGGGGGGGGGEDAR